MKKFSDFAEEKPSLEGLKQKLDDIINTELIITGFKVLNSKFKEGKCLQLQVTIEGQYYVIFTASKVLLDLIEKYANEIPFAAKIIKVNKYYTFA